MAFNPNRIRPSANSKASLPSGRVPLVTALLDAIPGTKIEYKQDGMVTITLTIPNDPDMQQELCAQLSKCLPAH